MNKTKIITFNRKPSITFEKCGLNIEKNFLQAPICECGCGGKASIVLNSQSDVSQFCGQMCAENDCNQCAVFAINKDNSLIGAIKLGDDIRIIGSTGSLDDYGTLGEIADEFELHCYGLICWYEDNFYNVIER